MNGIFRIELDNQIDLLFSKNVWFVQKVLDQI